MKTSKSKIYGATKEMRIALTNAFKKFAEDKDVVVLTTNLKAVQDTLAKLIEEVNS
jgi:predicted dinucleotide-binding enzyme